MKKYIVNSICTISGAVIGSLCSYFYLNRKFQKIADDEIKEMREYFLSKKKELSKNDEEENTIKTNENLNEHETVDTILKHSGYSIDPKVNLEDVEKYIVEESVSKNEPYVISPNDFAELQDYDIVTLIYFEDKILTDSEHVPVEDIDSIVGFDSLTTFGLYEEDAVYVRNPKLKRDYEIIKDTRKYLDVIIDS